MYSRAKILLDEESIREILKDSASMGSLNKLHQINIEPLSKSAKIDYLAALQKQMSFLQEWSNRVIIALAGDEEIDPFSVADSEESYRIIQDQDREEIAAALRIAPATAQLKIDAARLLSNHLPLTTQALAAGEISAAHATVIARETERAIRSGLSTDSIQRVEERALAHAELHTPGQVANKVKSLIAKISPEDFQESVEEAMQERKVDFYPEREGMATVIALLPAAHALSLKNALDALAQISLEQEEIVIGREKFQRSMDQRRADALGEIASKALNDLSEFYKPQRRPVTVNITMDLPTALGMADNPALLQGYGSIPGSVARALAADGKWRRFISDPISGTLLDFGREIYEPPQALRDFLIARDRTCRFPGCRRAGYLSDLDHSQSWESGGTTSAENLGLLCRRHHRLKTHGGWQVVSSADGSCLWKSPEGKSYEVGPRPIDEIV